MTKLTSLDPSETALIVVDMQKGFLAEDGGLARAGVDNSNQRAIIPKVRELVECCHERDVPVLWARQVHFAGDVTRKRHRIPTHLDKRNLELCYAGTPDTEIADGLADAVGTGDVVFEKHRSSCFFDTTLATKLRMLGTQLVVVCGVNSNYCVDSTVRDAYFRDFDVVVVEECIAGSFDDLHRAFLKNFSLYFGELMQLDELREALRTGSRETAAAGSAAGAGVP